MVPGGSCSALNLNYRKYFSKVGILVVYEISPHNDTSTSTGTLFYRRGHGGGSIPEVKNVQPEPFARLMAARTFRFKQLEGPQGFKEQICETAFFRIHIIVTFVTFANPPTSKTKDKCLGG